MSEQIVQLDAARRAKVVQALEREDRGIVIAIPSNGDPIQVLVVGIPNWEAANALRSVVLELTR